jgi:hypothetical protein
MRKYQILPGQTWTNKLISGFEPEDFDETAQLLHQMVLSAEQGKLRFKGIGFDSLSFSQSTFKLSLEDDRYEARVSKDDARAGLIDRFRLDQADWGPIASIMKRVTAPLNKLSKYGVMVVANASMVENPRWNRALRAAPAFQGKEFPSVVNGYFDFILFIVKPFEVLKDGRILPPTVAYRSDDGDFVAKCCNVELLKKGTSRLNYEKMLEVIRQTTNTPDVGACIMTYSDFGWGKTHALGTLPGPIAIIVTEPRDPRLVLGGGIERKEVIPANKQSKAEVESPIKTQDEDSPFV